VIGAVIMVSKIATGEISETRLSLSGGSTYPPVNRAPKGDAQSPASTQAGGCVIGVAWAGTRFPNRSEIDHLALKAFDLKTQGPTA
jgi:hypothetical protein